MTVCVCFYLVQYLMGFFHPEQLRCFLQAHTRQAMSLHLLLQVLLVFLLQRNVVKRECEDDA